MQDGGLSSCAGAAGPAASQKCCWSGRLESAPPPCIADQSQIGTSKGLFFIVTTATPGGVTEVLLERAARPKEPQHNGGDNHSPDQRS